MQNAGFCLRFWQRDFFRNVFSLILAMGQPKIVTENGAFICHSVRRSPLSPNARMRTRNRTNASNTRAAMAESLGMLRLIALLPVILSRVPSSSVGPFPYLIFFLLRLSSLMGSPLSLTLWLSQFFRDPETQINTHPFTVDADF